HHTVTTQIFYSIHILTLYIFFFFFNAPATTEIYTLSLHDALPIWMDRRRDHRRRETARSARERQGRGKDGCWLIGRGLARLYPRSEEHTSELQSRGHLVCRLLLEKKKKRTKYLSLVSACSTKTCVV